MSERDEAIKTIERHLLRATVRLARRLDDGCHVADVADLERCANAISTLVGVLGCPPIAPAPRLAVDCDGMLRVVADAGAK